MAPENLHPTHDAGAIRLASMRPGLDGPGKQSALSIAASIRRASMRPGLDGPGKPCDIRLINRANLRFNEAGAGWPRKTICSTARSASTKELQ